MKRIVKFFKDAITGRFVSKKYTEDHTATTYASTTVTYSPEPETAVAFVSMLLPAYCYAKHRFIGNVVEIDVYTNYVFGKPHLWYPLGKPSATQLR